MSVKEGRLTEHRPGLFDPAFFMRFLGQTHIPESIISKSIKKSVFLYTKMSVEIVIYINDERSLIRLGRPVKDDRRRTA